MTLGLGWWLWKWREEDRKSEPQRISGGSQAEPRLWLDGCLRITSGLWFLEAPEGMSAPGLKGVWVVPLASTSSNPPEGLS